MDKSERTWKYQLARLGHSCLRIRLSFYNLFTQQQQPWVMIHAP
jgi:hypothetical protein